jgi:hypothetical protein
VERLDMSKTAVENVGDSFCSSCGMLRAVSLPPTLKVVGAYFMRRSSVEGLDLSKTALENVGDSFCSGCWMLREVSLPPTLKRVGADFLRGSSVERLDLSNTALKDTRSYFCAGCLKLREVLLPGTLMSLYCVTWADLQLTLVVLPVASGMGIGTACSVSVLSGLMGLGSVPTRPLWPAK